MLLVKSSKNKYKLLLREYRYHHVNKSRFIWCHRRNDCANRVRFDGTGYIKVTFHVHTSNEFIDEHLQELISLYIIKKDIQVERARALLHF